MIGIDISKWNAVDWDRVDFKQFDVMSIKAGGGDDGIYPDTKFQVNYTQSLRAKYRQAYWFLGRYTPYKEQVDYFYDLLKGKDFNLIPCLDIEHPANGLPDDSLNWYLNEVYPYAVKKFGYELLSYSAGWWLNPRYQVPYPKNMKWWLASYTDRLFYPNNMDASLVVAWQKSDAGRFTGFLSNVDVDEIFDVNQILMDNKVTITQTPFAPYETTITDKFKEVNFRKTPDATADANILGAVKAGEKVAVTGETTNGWTPVRKSFVLDGFMKSELLNPNVTPAPVIPPPIIKKKVRIGTHDWHDGSLGNAPVLITLEMNQGIDINRFKAYSEAGGDIYVRCSWNYSWPSVPKNLQEITAMGQYYKDVFSKIGKYVKGCHIFNEPNLEIFPFGFTPESLGEAHNSVAAMIRSVSDVKISPAPLAWFAGTFIPNTWNYFAGQETPEKIALRFWGAIKPEFRNFYVAHTYSFGVDQSPDEKFTNWPLQDVYRSIRNIENQFETMKKFGYGDVDVFIGETNFNGDKGNANDFNTDWFQRTQDYFSKFSRIVGAAFFRWNSDKVNGLDFSLGNKPKLIQSLKKTL